MNTTYNIGFSFVMALLLFPAQAADINAGKNRSAMCMGCHGNAGVSNSGMFPSLAGQSSAYLESQLKHFRSGERSNATMNAMSKDLKDADIQNLAAYYASLPGKSAGGDASLAQLGKEKAAMCMGCHGNALQGNGQFPKLAGQHPEYISMQLANFKSGARKAGQMNAIAKTLSDDDIKALAEYAGSL
ncbi:MAG: cytochrome c4 [Methylomonas sp.]|jgi:cytochrome c553|uniref:c-type cytochrome n=1 Tax=Methylomonas sp. TaxID=418 RepID=UPI0025D2426E|nr:c-type cytochrome [Methylomonas sp.]MCK9605684.1 cytochrome c4 [Methylomonas sp.]